MPAGGCDIAACIAANVYCIVRHMSAGLLPDDQVELAWPTQSHCSVVCYLLFTE